MFNFYKKEKKEPQNLKEIFSYLKGMEGKITNISGELEKLKRESKFMVQKVGVLRYNPFSGVGSNQSFSIVLLDANNDGVIVTSLYTREGNRVFSKPIKNGQSEYPLSEEEKEAILNAINKNGKENGKTKNG